MFERARMRGGTMESWKGVLKAWVWGLEKWWMAFRRRWMKPESPRLEMGC